MNHEKKPFNYRLILGLTLLVLLCLLVLPLMTDRILVSKKFDALAWVWMALIASGVCGLWYQASRYLDQVFDQSGPQRMLKGFIRIFSFLILLAAMAYLGNMIASPQGALTPEEAAAQQSEEIKMKCYEECKKEASEKDRSVCSFGCL